MRLPMKARSTHYLLTLAAAGVLLAGCSGEATAPATQAKVTASQVRTSPFVPTAAEKALVGVVDGTYMFTVDAQQDQAVHLGPNYLSLPANSICEIGTSSYGAGTWNDSCTPHQGTVTITAVVKNAATDHPSIDFYPAMRFAPAKLVNLYIYVPVGMEDFQRNWNMKYCADGSTVCVDESRIDADLASYADPANKMVFRRIKHFSGYVVITVTEEGTEQFPQ
jgi:hypothetical protein